VADWLWPFSDAVMITVALLLRVPLVAVNVALFCPFEKDTLAGTGRLALLLDRVTVVALTTG
jgi:hypothetical protein